MGHKVVTKIKNEITKAVTPQKLRGAARNHYQWELDGDKPTIDLLFKEGKLVYVKHATNGYYRVLYHMIFDRRRTEPGSNGQKSTIDMGWYCLSKDGNSKSNFKKELFGQPNDNNGWQTENNAVWTSNCGSNPRSYCEKEVFKFICKICNKLYEADKRLPNQATKKNCSSGCKRANMDNDSIVWRSDKPKVEHGKF